MIKDIYYWFFNQPFTIQLSIGWLASCLLTLSIVSLIYDPKIILVVILIGISIVAVSKILLHYIFRE